MSLTFDAFYRDAFPQGIRFLVSAYGQNPLDAEEIVQDALVAFLNDHPDLSYLEKPYAFFKAYLRMRTLQVVTIPMARPVTLSDAPPSKLKDKRKHSLDILVGENQQPYGDLLPSSGPSVEASVMARLEWEEICAAINTLPLAQRVMVYMRACGYSHEEIAESLQKRFGMFTPLTVNQTLITARHAIRLQTQVRKVTARIKRAKPNQPWAKLHAACKHCGTTEIAHRAYGYCRVCFDKLRRQLRRDGIEQNKRQYAWSKAYPACVACGTTEHRHRGHGYCRPCHWNLFESSRQTAS
jgi:DNA-directed RNA polymerase specialized sigma24 family protein/ribosomal protein L32